MKIESGIGLEAGEEVVFELKVTYGRSWWQCLLGKKRQGFLVVTNNRIAEVYNEYTCHCCLASRDVKYVIPRSIMEVGYERVGICCKHIEIYYEALTQKTSFVVESEETARKLVDAMYHVINAGV